MAKSEQLPYIKIKTIYIKVDKINFFYFDEIEDVLYIGVDGNILTIELDRKDDDIESILKHLDKLVKYKEIC